LLLMGALRAVAVEVGASRAGGRHDTWWWRCWARPLPSLPCGRVGRGGGGGRAGDRGPTR